jgi:hypothetical protein
MSKQTEVMKTCAETLGFKGRFALLAFGVLGLFFPGLVTYLLLSGMAKGLKDVDIQQMLEELADD